MMMTKRFKTREDLRKQSFGLVIMIEMLCQTTRSAHYAARSSPKSHTHTHTQKNPSKDNKHKKIVGVRQRDAFCPIDW